MTRASIWDIRDLCAGPVSPRKGTSAMQPPPIGSPRFARPSPASRRLSEIGRIAVRDRGAYGPSCPGGQAAFRSARSAAPPICRNGGLGQVAWLYSCSFMKRSFHNFFNLMAGSGGSYLIATSFTTFSPVMTPAIVGPTASFMFFTPYPNLGSAGPRGSKRRMVLVSKIVWKEVKEWPAKPRSKRIRGGGAHGLDFSICF